jgi:hypothetical protein
MKTEIWPWAPKGCPTPRKSGRLTVGHIITSTYPSSKYRSYCSASVNTVQMGQIPRDYTLERQRLYDWRIEKQYKRRKFRETSRAKYSASQDILWLWQGDISGKREGDRRLLEAGTRSFVRDNIRRELVHVVVNCTVWNMELAWIKITNRKFPKKNAVTNPQLHIIHLDHDNTFGTCWNLEC